MTLDWTEPEPVARGLDAAAQQQQQQEQKPVDTVTVTIPLFGARGQGYTWIVRPRILGRWLFIATLLSVAAPLTSSAQRLPATVVPSHYDLAFDIDLDRARFTGDERIQVRIDEATNRIVLHAVEITFREVTIESGGRRQRASVSTTAQLALFTVPQPIAPGRATIHITYAGVLNSQLRGLYLSQANGRRYAVSQMEATDARRAFPSFDEPAFKATFAISATIAEGDTAISNGRVIADVPGPGPGRHTLTFSTTAKMSSYLVALAVGDFTCLSGSADRIPVRVCATPDKAHLGQLALDAAQHIVTFFNDYYEIDYPFGKIDLVAVPDFSAGAMENTAAIFYRETFLLADAATASVDTRKRIASVLAHELAHQWFGDLVTMAWWDDIWLNEGFATWMQNRPLAAWKPEWRIDVDEALETQTALELDSLLSTRAIQASVETNTDIDSLFDPIAYEKGASVLRMVEGFIGPEAFRAGVNAYLKKYAYANATSRDFWTVLADTSGQPVDTILATFVTQPGVPVVRVAYTCGPEGVEQTLTQQRFLIGAQPPRPTTWSVPVCVKDAQLATKACAVLPRQGGRTLRSDAGPGFQCPSPWTFINAGATGYYRSEYAPDLLAAMAPRVQAQLSAPERLSLLGDEWAMVRAGRHAVGHYLTLVAGFGNETSSVVIGRLAGRIGTIRSYLTTPETRPRFDAFVRRLFGPLATVLGPNTIPGEDAERTAVRAVVVQMLAAAGGDGVMLDYVRQAVDAALDGTAPLDPATADSLVAFAASRGDARLYDRFLAASRGATSPEVRDRYLRALTSFTDPALVQRSLDFALTPELRSQDTPTFLARLLANPDTNERTWHFVKAHWDEFAPKALNFLGGANVAGALGSFCDARSRDDIQAFFRTHRLPSGERALAQSMERIDGCIALKQAQTSELTTWLAGQPR